MRQWGAVLDGVVCPKKYEECCECVSAANFLVDGLIPLLILPPLGFVGGQTIEADRRHQRTATARAVKTTMTTKATKKVRAMMARVTRAMSETSPREKGDDGHNNQLSTKVAAAVRIVVAIYRT